MSSLNIFEAAKNGDLDRVIYLIEVEKVDINSQQGVIK